jgi:hypothetical protein
VAPFAPQCPVPQRDRFTADRAAQCGHGGVGQSRGRGRGTCGHGPIRPRPRHPESMVVNGKTAGPCYPAIPPPARHAGSPHRDEPGCGRIPTPRGSATPVDPGHAARSRCRRWRRTGERDARAVAWVEAAPWPTLLWPTEPIGERNRRGSVMENRGPAGDDGLSSAPGRRGLSPELRRTTHGLLSGFTLPPLRSTGQSVVAPDEVLGPAERSPVAGGLANVDERRRTQRHLIGAGPPGR